MKCAHFAWVILVSCIVGCDGATLNGELDKEDASSGRGPGEGQEGKLDAGIWDGGGARFHPEGYVTPARHGQDLKMQGLDCRGCHGGELEGTSSAPSCDDCHMPATRGAWRTNCTFCHGGVSDTTGAPPRNLDGTREATTGRFPPHTAHVGTQLAKRIDCVECHTKALDVLSTGHVFDDTHGAAEVDFGGSRSAQGAWDNATGTCSNLYCHGTGRVDDGQVRSADGAMTCTSCHPGPSSTGTRLESMSGAHALHLGVTGVTCADCHQTTTRDGRSIADATLHIDGARQVAFSEPAVSFSATAKTCSGTCHNHAHDTRAWQSSAGRHHPSGFALASAHGPELELGRQDCRTCHGTNLTGGSAPSCDNCHRAGWRTSCTYCHGGKDNMTGAPPRDLGATAATVSQSFRSHTAHVASGMTARIDCTECHVKPTDVLSSAHVFDATQGGIAEVSMAQGRSAAGTYNGMGGCATLYCHSNGRGDTGASTDGSPPLTCRSCHPDRASGATAWRTMSGDHALHLGRGIQCGECHSMVTRDGATILAPQLHIDKQRSVSFLENITYTAGTRRCSGSCHGEGHNFTW